MAGTLARALASSVAIFSDRSDSVPPNRRAATGAGSIDDYIGHSATRSNAKAEASNGIIPNREFSFSGLYRAQRPLCNSLTHLIALFRPRAIPGNTGKGMHRNLPISA